MPKMRYPIMLLFFVAICSAQAFSERAFQLAVLPNSDCYFLCENAALVGTTAEGLLSFFNQSDPTEQDDSSAKGALRAFLSAVNSKLPFRDIKAVKRSQGCFAWAGTGLAAVADSRFLYAWELFQPLALTEVQAVIQAEAESCAMRVLVQQGGQPKVLEISFPDKPELPTYSIAFLAGNTVILMGERARIATVVNNIENSLAGESLPAELQAAKAKVPAGSNFYALFVPNATMKAAALKRAAETPQAAIFNDLNNLVFALAAAEQTEVTMRMQFANAQSATLGKSMLIDGLFLGMLKMHLLQLSEKPIPMLETMKSQLQGTDAIFSCTIAADDLQTLEIFTKSVGQKIKSMVTD